MVTAALLLALVAHPLHTTMTELTVDEPHHSMRAVVRVFADDIGSAARRYPSAEAYVARTLSVSDATGRAIALHSCGTRRSGAVLFMCAEGSYAGSVRALKVSNSLLCDLFDDQVNLVQISLGAEHHSLLFTRGDAAKFIL